MSLMYIANSNGPSMLPCGTPEADLRHDVIVPSSLWPGMCCRSGIALEKSSSIRTVSLLSSTAFLM